jgi:glycosyltransferase involved in cell wall biosynthesis
MAPERADIWVQYGHALKESGHRDEAERAYHRALAIDSRQADTHLQLGHLLKLEQRFGEAGPAYLRALQLDPAQYDALHELAQLASTGAYDPGQAIVDAIIDTAGLIADETQIAAPSSVQQEFEEATSVLERISLSHAVDVTSSAVLIDVLEKLRGVEVEAPAAECAPDAEPMVVFDVADLISYFGAARLPTGIQRVQIEVISGLLRRPGRGGAVKVCCFSQTVDTWVELPPGLFLRLSDLSLQGGGVADPRWKTLLLRLGAFMKSAEPMAFPRGAFLINLGTSWWLQNYFLQVRRAQAEYGIQYVPFVHDFIPIIAPEHCVRELTQDFISWALGVFQHARFFLVNSQSTKRDLIAVAARLGHQVNPDQIEVIRLDADFRKPIAEPAARTHRTFGLRTGGYVLFVSTIESRKNHLGAFNAWLELAQRHGVGKIPKLVCVGSQGWLNDAVHAKLRGSEALRARVVMLSKLADAELADLYENCLFTLYPSHYEGWGLPVTESLCHGKVPLVSDAASLPEAGGEFANYFEAGSDEALLTALERLIFDAPHRRARERLIAKRFRPRRWTEIGEDIGNVVSQWSLEAPGFETEWSASAMPAKLGVYYPLTRNFSTRIWSGMVAGEMFRTGSGWWWPDDWGVWTRPEGGGLSMRIDGAHRAVRGFFRIRGLIRSASDWELTFTSPSGDRRFHGHMGPDGRCCVIVDFPASDGGSDIAAVLRGSHQQDLASMTEGLDHRLTSIGIEGFYLCEINDFEARLNFSEAMGAWDFERLTPGYDAR